MCGDQFPVEENQLITALRVIHESRIHDAVLPEPAAPEMSRMDSGVALEDNMNGYFPSDLGTRNPMNGCSSPSIPFDNTMNGFSPGLMGQSTSPGDVNENGIFIPNDIAAFTGNTLALSGIIQKSPIEGSGYDGNKNSPFLLDNIVAFTGNAFASSAMLQSSPLVDSGYDSDRSSPFHANSGAGFTGNGPSSSATGFYAPLVGSSYVLQSAPLKNFNNKQGSIFSMNDGMDFNLEFHDTGNDFSSSAVGQSLPLVSSKGNEGSSFPTHDAMNLTSGFHNAVYLAPVAATAVMADPNSHTGTSLGNAPIASIPGFAGNHHGTLDTQNSIYAGKPNFATQGQSRRAAEAYKPPPAVAWHLLDADEQALARFCAQKSAEYYSQLSAVMSNIEESVYKNKWWYTAKDDRGVNMMPQKLRDLIRRLAEECAVGSTAAGTSPETAGEILQARLL